MYTIEKTRRNSRNDMNIEQQVCSLEQSKKLHELGVNAESKFWHVPWVASDCTTNFICQRCDKGYYHSIEGEVETLDAPISYAAYTVAELGEMIAEIDNGNIDACSYYNNHMGYWSGIISRIGMEPEIINSDYEEDTEANVRAEMLIFLIENKYLSLEEVNCILAD